MFWWIVAGVIGVSLLFWIILGTAGKTKTSKEVKELKEKHPISFSVCTMLGYLAFNDTDKKLYYCDWMTKKRLTFDYDAIISSTDMDDLKIWISVAYPERNTHEAYANNKETKKFILDKLEGIVNNNSGKAKAEYETIISIPSTAASVKVHDYIGTRNIAPGGVLDNTYLWKEEQKLYLMAKFMGSSDFMTRRNAYNPVIIDIKNIVELSQSGDVHYSTTVSGGGGGGSSIKGAVVGGILAGGVGAVIGSRKPVESISSSTSRIDDRRTYLKVLDENNKLMQIIFDYDDYYVIKKIIED